LSAHGVMLVEDDTDIRQDLAEILREEGYPVVTAENGRDALDKLRGSSPPCLIILDLMMPVMDGWAFRAEQLRDPALAGVPVLVVSGVANVQRQASTMNAVAYVEKPIQLDSLLGTVKAHCGDCDGDVTPPPPPPPASRR
jgi:CheY-like chemotaxis protein